MARREFSLETLGLIVVNIEGSQTMTTKTTIIIATIRIAPVSSAFVRRARLCAQAGRLPHDS